MSLMPSTAVMYGGVPIDPMTGLPKMQPPTAQQQPSFMDRVGGLLGGGQSYGGLLSPEDEKAARNRALMAMGASLLASSGPSPVRVGTGQALGQAVMAGMGAQDQANQSTLQSLLLKSQIEKAKQKDRGKLVPVIGDDGKPTYRYEADAEGMTPYEKAGSGIGAYQPGDYTPESWADFAKTNDPAILKRYVTPRQEYSPSYQNVNRTLPDGSTQQGTFDTRTGAYNWTGPVVPPGKKNEVDAAGAARGKATGEAQSDLPRQEDNAQLALRTIQDLKKHPGLPYITGVNSMLPIIPGTLQAGADSLAKQIQGKTFLEAFNTLKGGGQITEIEGAKAESAIARLQRAQNRREYVQALTELEDVINLGLSRARVKAGGAPAGTANNEVNFEDLD